MLERYYQLTCDACGETDWTQSFGKVADLIADGWRARKGKHLCPKCAFAGVPWKDATLHEPRPPAQREEG